MNTSLFIFCFLFRTEWNVNFDLEQSAIKEVFEKGLEGGECGVVRDDGG